MLYKLTKDGLMRSVYDLTNGFLPFRDPIHTLPRECKEWEELASNVPKLLTSDYTRIEIEKLGRFPIDTLRTSEGLERAMLLLSYLGHAYVWCDLNQPAQSLPTHFAQSWYDVSQAVGRPPVLSYASYALYNWKRMDPAGPIALGNIALLQNFLGGIDEEWFILIHVDIEAKAAAAIPAIIAAQSAASEGSIGDLMKYVKTIATSLNGMISTLKRMPEHCDPYIYFNRVRPYIHGWKDNPALPNGLLYTGVSGYDEKPVKFKGETGAQSTIIPALDACFGVEHPPSLLQTHLEEMVSYMPPTHRTFLQEIQRAGNIRACVKNSHREDLISLYNQCIQDIHVFRSIHLNYAKAYIEKQAQRSTGNPSHVGTGGTPFIDYLTAHCDETLMALI